MNENTAQWLTTIFMLVNEIMIPITVFLMETFSTRGLFLVSMSIFAFATLICAIASGFPLLMAGRVIQATGAAMGMVGLVIAFGPVIGPALSGWFLQYFHFILLH